jgi:hypothetical protein
MREERVRERYGLTFGSNGALVCLGLAAISC